MMFHANNPERHTVGIAGPTHIKGKASFMKKTDELRQSTKSGSKKNNGVEKVGKITKKSINTEKKGLNSGRKQTAPINTRNPIVTVERTSVKEEVIPLQQ